MTEPPGGAEPRPDAPEPPAAPGPPAGGQPPVPAEAPGPPPPEGTAPTGTAGNEAPAAVPGPGLVGLARRERAKASRRRSGLQLWATILMVGLGFVSLMGLADVRSGGAPVSGWVMLIVGIAGIAGVAWFKRRSVSGPGALRNPMLLDQSAGKTRSALRAQAGTKERPAGVPGGSAAGPDVAAAPVPADTDQAGSQASQFNAAVLEELARLGTERKGWINRLAVLAVSVMVFIGLGLFQDTLTGLLTIAAVILLHELGHYLAMRAFGYRDVSMFFIPMFGAATSGRETDPAGWKRAVVSLMGPMPGLLAGLVLAVASAVAGWDLGADVAITLVAINAFNLLPFLPLDGGRILQDILFCRNRHLEFVSTLVSGLLLAAAGWGLKSWLLGVMGAFAVVEAFNALKESAVADRLRPGLAAGAVAAPRAMPPEAAGEIIAQVGRAFPRLATPQLLAPKVDAVWRRLRAAPPGCLAAGALLTVYGGGFLACLLALGVAALASSRGRVEEFARPDGSRGLKEVGRILGAVASESELSDDGLYHGRSVTYVAGTAKLLKEGVWQHGRWHGEWKDYDAQGRVIAVTVFDEGRFVARRELTPDGWLERKLDELPGWMCAEFRRHAASPPQGPGPAKLPGAPGR